VTGATVAAATGSIYDTTESDGMVGKKSDEVWEMREDLLDLMTGASS